MTVENAKRSIRIDLNEFKLHVHLKNKLELTLHFNSPSRRFYLSLIAFVVDEMKRLGKITSIPLEGHHDLLALLNDTVGGSAGSSDKEHLLPRIYRKWQHALPDLEGAPLFRVLGKRKEYDEETNKTYPFTEAEKDIWANLFEYQGSEENVRLKFAIDRVGATLDDIAIVYENSLNGEAWEKYISSLKQKKAEPVKPVSEEPDVAAPPLEGKTTSLPRRYRWVALMAVIVAVLGAITLAIWKAYLKPDPGDVASKDKMAFPLPDVPSIAVMPFLNISGDPKQEFLCDGITEEIITALSKVPRLFVISRQSTLFYKGKPVRIRQVSEELGVQYVLQGSVQRSADRIRVTVQLIDALTGHHLMAERYERDLKDLFALEDEITIKILTAVQVKLTGGGHVGSPEKYYRGKQGLDCYLKLMEANGIRLRLTIQDINVARRMIEEVILLCPENPIAYAMLGWIYQSEYAVDSTKASRETIEKGIKLGQKALAIDDSIPSAHTLLSYLYMFTGEYDKAIAEGEQAVALDPGGASALMTYGHSLHFAGRAEEAIPFLRKAIRLSPSGPSIYYFLFGYALMGTGRFEEAISAFNRAIQRAPDYILPHVGLAATYSMMGREKEARAAADEVLRINPKFSVDKYAKQFLLKDQSEMNKIVNALGKAGLK